MEKSSRDKKKKKNSAQGFASLGKEVFELKPFPHNLKDKNSL